MRRWTTLHQGYRVPANGAVGPPGCLPAERGLAAMISGAGPTVLTFARGDEQVREPPRLLPVRGAEPRERVEDRRLNGACSLSEIDTEGVMVTQ